MDLLGFLHKWRTVTITNRVGGPAEGFSDFVGMVQSHIAMVGVFCKVHGDMIIGFYELIETKLLIFFHFIDSIHNLQKRFIRQLHDFLLEPLQEDFLRYNKVIVWEDSYWTITSIGPFHATKSILIRQERLVFSKLSTSKAIKETKCVRLFVRGTPSTLYTHSKD